MEGVAVDVRYAGQFQVHRAILARIMSAAFIADRTMASEDSRWDGLLVDCRLATLAGDDYGIVEDAALAWKDGCIAWLGPRARLPGAPAALAYRVSEGGNAWVTPALVDCHTHLVFGGNRAVEAERRLQGASYEQIAREGGGILSTVRATRALDQAGLLAASLPRARALLADGVGTIEIKSGYGLDFESERRMLRVARAIAAELGVSVRTTFLAAHALPPEYSGRADEYVDAARGWLHELDAEGLVDAVDAFCEGIGFSPAQTRRMFETARELGLPVKLHADQLSDLGGAALVAEFGGLSADHIEHSSEDAVRAMAAAGTVAVLLPGAYHFLRETKLPPLEALRAHGVPMAVATDLNPGTSPLASLRLAMSLACTHFRLTPLEALRGATLHAARALGLHDRGRLATGLRADFALWRVEHPAELAYWLGGDLLEALVLGGKTTKPR
jgi:imidazolonepropionase